MLEVQTTENFLVWINAFRAKATQATILRHIDRVRGGNLGDVKPVGDGVSELRVDHGPGYRVYFVRRGRTLIVLLCGGDKSSQDRDIREAKKLASQL